MTRNERKRSAGGGPAEAAAPTPKARCLFVVLFCCFCLQKRSACGEVHTTVLGNTMVLGRDDRVMKSTRWCGAACTNYE